MNKIEQLNQCPVCSSEKLHTGFLHVKDHTVSGEQFAIDQCKNCGFKFTNPRPTLEQIGHYYQSSDYISHHDDAENLMAKVYNLVRNYTTSQKITLLESHTKERTPSLLDIGCGAGFFLQQCVQKRWNVSGTEPDPDARAVASKRVGEELYASIEHPSLQNKQFDLITMWHVLEHVHDLNGTIEWLMKHLQDNGTLFIAVPNNASYDAQVFKANWAAYDVPRHLYHFTKETMSALLNKHGFAIKEILPMWFDTFYVNMLSNQYRHNSKKLPNSFITGLVSNWKGRKTSSNEYNTSSLIYVIQKKA